LANKNFIVKNDIELKGNLIFEGATKDSYETTLAITDPTADRTITFPNSTGTIALTSGLTLENVTDGGATTTNAITISNGTASSSTTTGALIVTGGVGIGEDLYVDNDIYVGGNINITGTITGDLTSIDVTNLVVTDPLIYLAEDNASDGVDIGIFAAYNHSNPTKYHTGLIRDANDSGKWKLASNLLDPTSNVIDFTGATFDTLKVGALEVTNASTTRTNLGLGTIATESASSYSPVAGSSSITTVGTIGTGTWQGTAITDTYVANDLTISGGTINATPIGATTPSTGKFTNVDIDGEVLIDTFVGTGTGSASETAANETAWGSTYSCAEYIVSVSNGTTGRYTSKVMLMCNGSASSITEYAIQTVGTITAPTITAGTTASALKLRINAVDGYAITLVRTLVTA
jgi:hypothetical protein